MNVFICKEIIVGKGHLPEDEAFHCFKVMRMKVGDQIHLIDGYGNFYNGEIEVISKKQCIVHIDKNWKEAVAPYRLHLAIAPTKNISRFEWFIEKAVEIGIHEITPVFCDRSERKRINLDRCKKIAVSAVKQSLSATIPVINEAKTFKDFIKQDLEGLKLIAHLEKDTKHLKKMLGDENTFNILVGPEGDFSESELSLAKVNNWQAVILGNKRLRTETAGIVSTQIVNAYYF